MPEAHSLEQPDDIRRLSHTYSVTRWDLYRGQIYYLFQSKPHLGILLFIILFGIGTFLRATNWEEFSLLAMVIYVVITVVLHSAIVFGIFFVIIGFFTLIQPYKGVVGEHTLEFREEGLLESTVYNETLAKWSSMHKVAFTRNLILIFITDSNWHVLPRRSFSSPEEESRFIETLNQRLS